MTLAFYVKLNTFSAANIPKFTNKIITEKVGPKTAEIHSLSHKLIINGLNFEIKIDNFYEIDNKLYRSINTCPYDSLYEILIAAYQSSKEFRTCVFESSKREEINILKSLNFYMKKTLSDGMKNIYEDRCKIMLKTKEAKNSENESYSVLD